MKSWRRREIHQVVSETSATPSRYIDQSFIGQDNTPINVTNGPNQFTKVGDFDGDGIPDTLTVSFGGSVGVSISLGNSNSISLTQAQGNAISSYFSDTAAGGAAGSGLGAQLLQAEGLGIASRFTVADFSGDGRDDILINGFDGKAHLLISQGTGFSGPYDASAPTVGGSGTANWAVTSIGTRNTWIGDHYYVKPIACDLNGDGITDYACLSYQRFLTNTGGTTNGFLTIRSLKAVISNGDGTFSAPFQIGGASMAVPTGTYGNINSQQNVALDDMDCGVFAGDFNGDGLTDFLILVPVWNNQAYNQSTGTLSNTTPYTATYGGCRWVLYLNQGMGSNGFPQFAQYNGVIPNTIKLPTSAGETVNTWYCPFKNGGTGIWNGPIADLVGASTTTRSAISAFEGAAGATDTYIMDVNHDGMADLVWHVGVDSNDNAVSGASNAAGMQCCRRAISPQGRGFWSDPCASQISTDSPLTPRSTRVVQ